MKRKLVGLFILMFVFSPRAIVAQAAGNSNESGSQERLRDLETKLGVALQELADTQAQLKTLTSQVKQLQDQATPIPASNLQPQASSTQQSGQVGVKGDVLGVNPPPAPTEEGFIKRIIDPGLGGDQRNNTLSLRPELFVQARYSTLPGDGATIDDFKSNFRVSRAEMHWSGLIAPKFGAGFEIQYQPANDGSPTQLINDAYLQYYPFDHATITGGQFKLPFGFDTQQSSADRESPERAMIVEYFFPGQRDRGVLLQGDLDFLSGSSSSSFQYFAGVFNGNRLWSDNNRQVNYDFRLRKRFDSIHLAVGVSGQVGHQLLPPGVSGTDDQNAIGVDLQYAFRRFGFRTELVAGNMPSTAFSLTPIFFAAFVPGRHSAGGAAVATYALTFRDNIYVRFDQVNSDPQTDLTDQAVNFGYFRVLTRSERLGFDYQWKNHVSYNNNAVNTRFQVTWDAKF
jgi:hypothetical protein